MLTESLPQLTKIQRKFAGIQIELSKPGSDFQIKLFAHGDQPVGKAKGKTLAQVDALAAISFYSWLQLAELSLALKA